MFRNRVTIAAMFIAATIPASAADEFGGYGSSSDWSGIYIGVHGGHTWGQSDATAVGDIIQEVVAEPEIGPDAYDTSPSGISGGAQIGINRQFDQIVIGAEVSVSYGNISDTIADPRTENDIPNTITAEIDWLGSVRGRVGFDAGGTLFYGTGGLAWAHGKTTIGEGVPTESESYTLTGWVAGLGLEQMVSERVSLRGEYLYTDFGTQRLYEDVADGNFATDVDGHLHSVSIGLNYRF